MAKLNISPGIDQWAKKMEELGRDITPASKMGIYDAAGIVTEAIAAEIRAMKTVPDFVKFEVPTDGITQAQKDGLLDGLGISKMDDHGGVIDVKIGFDGYNKTVTKKYKKGQPNAMIARAINSGTSFRTKNRFVARAVTRSRGAAEAAILKRLNDAFNEAKED